MADAASTAAMQPLVEDSMGYNISMYEGIRRLKSKDNFSGGQVPPFQSRTYNGKFQREMRLESLIPILDNFGKL